jgi:hypothetical protein
MTIKTELLAIRKNGILQPDRVIEWAAKHPNSALHASLEWDDGKAAHEYRLEQVRKLIRIHVVTVEGTREMLSLSIDRINPGGGYRSIDIILSEPDLRAIALKDAFDDLERVKAKYQWLTELAAVWKAVDKAKPKRK